MSQKNKDLLQGNELHFLIFHANVSKFSYKLWLSLTDLITSLYGKIKNLKQYNFPQILGF